MKSVPAINTLITAGTVFTFFETFDGVLYAFGCLFQELHCKGTGSKPGFMRLRIGASGGETMSLSSIETERVLQLVDCD